MFFDRKDAGERLAGKLRFYRGQDIIVYGLPRGGVIVAAEVSKALNAPLDLLIVRKLTHPANPEYAIGAIGEHTGPILNPSEVMTSDKGWMAHEIANQRAEIARRKNKYLGDRPELSVVGKTAIIVDDGAATGLTMLAAIEELRERDPRAIVVALPVAPRDTKEVLADAADRIITLEALLMFRGGVGAYYENFDQTTDQEVIETLEDSILME